MVNCPKSPDKHVVVESQVHLIHDGSQIISKRYRSSQNPNGSILLVPGLTSPNHPKYQAVYQDLACAIAGQGWDCVIVTFRGQIGAPGEYSFPHAVDDLGRVVSDQERKGGSRMALLSRSSGAPIALQVAHLYPEVDRLLLWGCSPRHVYERLFGSRSDGSYMKACVDYGTIFASDFRETLFFPEDELPSVNQLVWLGVGTEDDYTTPAEQSEVLLKSTHAESLLYVVPRCPHSVTAVHPAWPAYWRMILTWMTWNSGNEILA